MTKVRSILGISLLSIFLMAGCINQTLSRSYTNTTYGFSLDPPQGWYPVENESPKIAVRFTPVNSSNVSVTVSVPFILSEGRALSTLADQVEEDLSESGVNYTILYRDWRSIPHMQAYEIAYSYQQDGAVEYAKQVAVLRTRTVFLITFTAPEPLVTQYLTEVDQSIQTFK
jgi:hypothetical protein